jgi:hypothetical protein
MHPPISYEAISLVKVSSLLDLGESIALWKFGQIVVRSNEINIFFPLPQILDQDWRETSSLAEPKDYKSLTPAIIKIGTGSSGLC